MKDKINEDLRRWFKEKWVDISKKDASGKHPPCGRSKSKKKGYPKCRPSSRVSSETPETSGEMSPEEKKKAVAQKRSAEKKKRKGKKPHMTSHKSLKEYFENTRKFLLINEGKNKPTNPKLWSKAKSKAKSKFKVYPSAYANAWAAKWYKKHGGGWESVNESFGKTMLGAGALGIALGLGGAAYRNANLQQEPEQPQAQQVSTQQEVEPEKPKPAAKPKVVAQPKQEKVYHHDHIQNMVKQDEGLVLKMYKDTRKIPTVGYGHNLRSGKSSALFQKAFGERGAEIRGHVLRGGSITKQQAEQLFNADYGEHFDRTVKMIPNLHEHPPDVQAALVSGVYRGHVTDSPKFRKLLNSGDYHGAATEFLNREEYTASDTPQGVLNRLNRDHQIYLNYANTKK